MSRESQQLGKLSEIARLRADADLRRYSAYRVQAEAMQRQLEAVRAELSEAIATPGSDALDQWRLTTALVAYRTGQTQQSEAALAKIKPGLDAAHRAAVLAFGRAEALSQLQALRIAEERRKAERKSW
jgi:hypothetical protein